MKHAPIIYQAIQFKHPVAIRPEFNETDPCHADMLRYDTAFCHPTDPSLVIFPLFRDPQRGTMPNKITEARWHSFSIRLHPFADMSRHDLKEQRFAPGVDDLGIHNLNDWYTYVHKVPEYGLERKTMAEYMAQYPKIKIIGYRQSWS